MRLDHEYWHFARKQPDFQGEFLTWISYWEGCVLCHCDHGCNQFVLENAAKAAALLRTRGISEDMDWLNELAQKDEAEFRTDLWKENYRKADERRATIKANNETKN